MKLLAISAMLICGTVAAQAADFTTRHHVRHVRHARVVHETVVVQQPAPAPVVVAPQPAIPIPVVGTVVDSSLRFAGTLIMSPLELFQPRRY
jgi:hypothetical protein